MALQLRGIIDRYKTVSTIMVNSLDMLREKDPPYNDPNAQDIAMVISYDGNNDTGGSIYYWKYDSEDADDDDIVIQPTNSLGAGRWIRFIGSDQSQYVSIDDFGAVGDGITDDTLAWNAAVATGKAIKLTAGQTYKLAGNHTRSITNRDFILYADAKARILLAGSGQTNYRLMYAKSDFEDEQAISAVTPLVSYSFSATGATDTSSVTVADGTAFAVGDVVKIISDDLTDGSDPSQNQREGEMSVIGAIVSNEVYLYSKLRYTYTTNIRIAKINKDRVFHMSNIEIVGDDGLTIDANIRNAVVADGYYRPERFSCSITNWGNGGFQTIGCYQGISLNTSGDTLLTQESQDRYGYLVTDTGGKGHQHHNIRAINVRHAYTTNWLGVDADDADIGKYGRCNDVSIYNGLGINCQHAPWDTHPDADGVDFYNCKAQGSYVGVVGEAWGFQARGWNVRFHNCVAETQGGFVISGGGTGTSAKGKTKNIELINCRHYMLSGITDSFPYALRSNGASGDEITGLFIQNFRSYTPSGQTSAPVARFDYTTLYYDRMDLQADMAGTNQNVIQTANATVRGKGLRVDFSGSSGSGFDIFKTFSSNDVIDITDTEIRAGNVSWRDLVDYNNGAASGTFTDVRWDLPPTDQDGARNNSSATHVMAYAGGWDTQWLGQKIEDHYISQTLDTSKWTAAVGTDAQCAVAIQSGVQRGAVRLTFGDDAAVDMASNGALKVGQLAWRPQDGAMFIESRFTLSSATNAALFVGFTDTTALEMPFSLGAGDVVSAVATDAFGILFDTAADTDVVWGVAVKAGVVQTAVNLGNALTSGGQVRWRVVCDASGNVTFWRNGVQVTGTISAGVTTSAIFAPVECGFSRNTTSKNMQIDYTTVSQGVL